MVSDGETGILFPVDDVTALKKAMEKLIRDPQLRKRLALPEKKES